MQKYLRKGPKKKKVEAREEAIMAASENENPQENVCDDRPQDSWNDIASKIFD